MCGNAFCCPLDFIVRFTEVGVATIQEITCACGCGRKKMVRTADVKRGWGRYFSKSCKAKDQEGRTGQYRDYLRREYKQDDYRDVENDLHPFDSYSLGQE